ncbi:MAG: chemotaxis protein CheD, partial [Spirochaetia bacterium]|nr:chemotaxis protein CheD [Spirochaetia bacterium]
MSLPERISQPAFLGIGQMLMSESQPLMTVVGSCLAIAAYVPGRSLAALSHAIYATRSSQKDMTTGPYHFVDEAIQATVAEFARLGVLPAALVFKIFGGASFQKEENPFYHPGSLNVETARRVLCERGLKL